MNTAIECRADAKEARRRAAAKPGATAAGGGLRAPRTAGPATKARTIYIVDANAEFCESTRSWLSGAGFEVQTWGDSNAAIEALSHHDRCEGACLMLDVHMPQLSGLDVHDALLERGAQLPVIYTSGRADVALAVRVMQKGAVSLLEKPFDDAALEAALDRAFACTGHYDSITALTVSRVLAANRERQLAHTRFREREAKLTPREREVISYVILGVYNKNIADRIGLSIKTVELYRARGMAKMQAHSVAELTRIMVSQQA